MLTYHVWQQALDAMGHTEHSVFISYARADSDWVTIAVNLLTAGGAKVFMDVRDIAYGDKWEDLLLSKLREVERVMVFWSRHAADSEWVTREWQLALNNGKRLVPVPIDATPLPDDLLQFQALTDLKPLLQQAVSGKRREEAEAPRASTGSWLRPVLLLAAIAVPIAILALIAIPTLPPIGVSPDNGGPPITRPDDQMLNAGVYTGVGVLVGATLALFLLARSLVKKVVTWHRRRRLRRTFGQYLPPDLLEEMARTSTSTPPEPELADRVVNMVFDEADKPS